MNKHSLDSLLQRLQQGSVTYGFGAILTFNRQQINRLLQEQYLSGMEGLHFLLPFTQRFFINDDQTEEIELRGIVLGVPNLSFESANLNTPALTLTQTIVSGSFTHFRRAVGAPPAVLSAFSITADMGFHVRLQADLHEAYGAVDKHGLVSMDLSIGKEVTCNLSTLPQVQAIIGGHFQRYFAGQPDVRRRFVLGRIKLTTYNPLSPVSFVIRTQRAPGAENRLAANYGDGAVVIFINVKGMEDLPPGAPPLEGSDFPYLLPDEPNDPVGYSASLLIARDLLPVVDEEQLDVLKNMLFPGKNLFVENVNGRHDPYDRVLFGNVRPTASAVHIEPAEVELGAHQSQTFVARRGDGSRVTAVSWTVSSPDYPTVLGDLLPNGTYAIDSHAQMIRNRLPLVVTAHYRQDGLDLTASALVHERFEAVNIAPLVQIKSGSAPAPVTVHASSLGSAFYLQFRLLEPTFGARLEAVDANSHNYYPPPVVQSEPVLVQTIEVTDLDSGARAQASMVLVNKSLYLAVTPHYVTGLAADGTVQLQVEGIPADELSWQVIGPGTVVDGLYEADPDAEALISVVIAELPAFGIYPAQYGISIINRQPVQTPDTYIPVRWEKLGKFEISAPGGLTKAYTNGLQQIPVLIEIQTAPLRIDGQDIYIPVSDVELSRLRLRDVVNNNLVPFVDSFQEGIEHDSTVAWAAHVRRNRFNLNSQGAAGETKHQPLPVPLNNGIRYRELYVHTTAQGTRGFYAEFEADVGGWWRSNDDNTGGEGDILLEGVLPPVPDTVVGPNREYDLVRERAFSGNGHVDHDLPDGHENKEFNYYLDSVDYWYLSYRRIGVYPVSFATLEVERNISAVQWESEALEETFFSYTGFAFYPARFRGSDQPPVGLSFDAWYRALLVTQKAPAPSTAFQGGKQPSPGQLLVSLHRLPDRAYWHDSMAGSDPSLMYRQKLDPPVIFVLLDEEGNRHRVQVAFEDPSIDDSRNKLTLNIQ